MSPQESVVGRYEWFPADYDGKVVLHLASDGRFTYDAQPVPDVGRLAGVTEIVGVHTSEDGLVHLRGKDFKKAKHHLVYEVEFEKGNAVVLSAINRPKHLADMTFRRVSD